MKKLFVLYAFASTLFIYACGGDANQPASGTESSTSASSGSDAASGNPSYDAERGAGKFNNVDIPANLDATMATSGEKVYNVKCASFHKLTDEKLVGPGWKGVTTRHKPEWIMNFITNPDEMIDKDPKAQAQLELCMVRMPNQNLSDDDARHVYEYMRQNDGVK